MRVWLEQARANSTSAVGGSSTRGRRIRSRLTQRSYERRTDRGARALARTLQKHAGSTLPTSKEAMVANRSRTSRSGQSAGAYSFGPAHPSLRGGPRQVSGPVARAVDPHARAPRGERPGSEPVVPAHVADRRILAASVTQSLAKRRYGDALSSILRLVMLEPGEPRWHQKYGEVLRTLGRAQEAAAAYRRAARRYEAMALPARASAALRVAEGLEGASSSSTAPTSSDRLRTQPLPSAEDRITARPPA